MGRAPCCDKANVKRGPWSPEEDAALKSYIERHGTGGNWIALPQKAGLKRCGKSCRLRWLNYLRPDIKHGGFTEEEDNIICTLYDKLGSRWSVIASHLPRRTDNDVKNYWNTKLKKKLMARQAIIPTYVTSNSTDHILRSPSSTLPPPPILPVLKTEVYSDFSMPLRPNYGPSQQSQRLWSQLMPLSMMNLIEQPDFLSPSDEVSAASSSVTVENSGGGNSYINLSTGGVGPNDSFFTTALGFGDTGDFLSGHGCLPEINLDELTPCCFANPSSIMWAASETKAQELYQSLTHS